jgi:hypothetical protein
MSERPQIADPERLDRAGPYGRRAALECAKGDYKAAHAAIDACRDDLEANPDALATKPLAAFLPVKVANALEGGFQSITVADLRYVMPGALPAEVLNETWRGLLDQILGEPHGR